VPLRVALAAVLESTPGELRGARSGEGSAGAARARGAAPEGPKRSESPGGLPRPSDGFKVGWIFVREEGLEVLNCSTSSVHNVSNLHFCCSVRRKIAIKRMAKAAGKRGGVHG